MLIAIVSTIISLICGMFAGYALARLRFRGSEFLGTAIFITYLVPQTLLFIRSPTSSATCSSATRRGR